MLYNQVIIKLEMGTQTFLPVNSHKARLLMNPEACMQEQMISSGTGTDTWPSRQEQEVFGKVSRTERQWLGTFPKFLPRTIQVS